MAHCSVQWQKFISWVRQDLSPLELRPATELLYQLQVTDE